MSGGTGSSGNLKTTQDFHCVKKVI